ncbi:MAG: serine hydrolase [Thiobacillaceae bacterium]|jgi:D-alanyl-D-alanine endopeptidase (penicillin-binding protein 7)
MKNLRKLTAGLLMTLSLTVVVPAQANSEPAAMTPQTTQDIVSYNPALSAISAMVYDQHSGQVLLSKNANLQSPIASITKLMTAVVLMDANVDMNERITITREDLDYLKGTRSRLPVGSVYTREQLLNMALIASENRAAHALGRTTFPGGEAEFVAAMNQKARQLGMQNTIYADPTGLDSINRSTAEDLVKLVNHAYLHYPEIRRIASTGEYSLGYKRVVLTTHSRKKRHHLAHRVAYREVAFANTNRLTRQDDWEIGLSKTGFINEAGHCLVMQARIAQREVIIVLLDSLGKSSRIGDATRIRNWLQAKYAPRT